MARQEAAPNLQSRQCVSKCSGDPGDRLFSGIVPSSFVIVRRPRKEEGQPEPPKNSHRGGPPEVLPSYLSPFEALSVAAPVFELFESALTGFIRIDVGITPHLASSLD